MSEWKYLGDGVYAKFDGHGIWLHANNHENPTDKIYLEPEIVSKLEEILILETEHMTFEEAQKIKDKPPSDRPAPHS